MGLLQYFGSVFIDPDLAKNLIQAVFLTLPKASLMVPDFTISVYSSSCHYLFFGLILGLLLSLSLNKPRKEERKRPKIRELHELPSTGIVKSGLLGSPLELILFKYAT